MPQPTKGPRLGGSPAHQRLILANLATSLFQHGKITTTEAKAKRLRPYAERLITKAKRGDLHNRREIQKVIRDRETVHRLMHEIGPFFSDRNGGYTRITKTLPRQGDNAPMAVIELIAQKTVTDEADRARRVAGQQRRRGGASTPSAESAAQSSESSESSQTSEVVEKAEEASEAALDAAAAAPEGSVAQDRAFDAAESAEEAADAATEADETSSTATGEPTTGSSTEVTADRNTVDEAEGSAAEPATEEPSGSTTTEHAAGSPAARTAAEDTPDGPTGAGRES